MANPMRQGLILLAHGARDPRWREPFERLADRVREKRPDVAVSLAFLELMAPDLLAAGEELDRCRLRRTSGDSGLFRPGWSCARRHPGTCRCAQEALPERGHQPRPGCGGERWRDRRAGGVQPWGAGSKGIDEVCVLIYVTRHNINYAQYSQLGANLAIHSRKAL